VAAFPLHAVAADAIDISFTEYTLDNGLRLIVHEDNKAPIVAVNVWYHVGSKNEKTGKTGFAHLFEHLMFNGSENFNDEYFKPFELVGATDMNGTTNFDRTNYFQNVPNTALDMALWMESDRMGHLLGAVTQERLDEQRGVVQNEKRQGDNQPYGQVLYHILAGVFPEGHPYSWSVIGSMDDLDAATLEDVHEWFKTYYGPNNAVIVVAGDIVPDEVYAKVQKYFGDIPPGPPIARHQKWEVQLEQDKREVLQDRVPQARFYKIWGGPHMLSEDADLLELAGDVLAGGKNSSASCARESTTTSSNESRRRTAPDSCAASNEWVDSAASRTSWRKTPYTRAIRRSTRRRCSASKMRRQTLSRLRSAAG
jgi:zinc protease